MFATITVSRPFRTIVSASKTRIDIRGGSGIFENALFLHSQQRRESLTFNTTVRTKVQVRLFLKTDLTNTAMRFIRIGQVRLS